MVYGDVLEASGLGIRFKDNFAKAVAAKGLPCVDWGQGIWQLVAKVYEVRKEFTHVQPTIDHTRLLAPASEAERSIAVLRDAIKEVCRLAGLASPLWVDDDADRGWNAGPGSMAHGMVIRDGADPEGPDTVRPTAGDHTEVPTAHFSTGAWRRWPEYFIVDRLKEVGSSGGVVG